jgi:hypothetical protein
MVNHVDSQVMESPVMQDGSRGDAAAGMTDSKAAPAGKSRRGLLALATGATAFAAAMKSASAQPVRVKGDVDPSALLEKLVDRITFGATPEELTLARQLGYQGYLEYHLNHLVIDDSAMNTRLAGLTTLTMTYPQLLTQTFGFVRGELTEATILRAAFSKRQLFERMVELWTDHFNIDIVTVQYYKTADDRDVIRPNALGTFPAMLNASARSPAMLYYLNNDVSTAANPNENYARELMELHTLGVDGGYTQTDVQQVALCLTGWTIWRGSSSGSLQGTFRYNNNNHNQTAKSVLGTPIPANGGQQDGITVLNLLINHPSTARYIATKMCRHFLGYDVSRSIIDQVAASYTATGGDIKAMLRVVLKPEHVAAARPKLKRPFHMFVAALRQTNAAVTSTSSLRTRLNEAGHAPFGWLTPDGYPDKMDHWAGNLIARWNYGASLMTGTSGAIAGLTVDDVAFFAGAVTADEMIARIDERLFGGRMDPDDRARIRSFLLPSPPTVTRRREAIGLALSAPSYQWY